MFKNIFYNIFFIFLWFCDLVFAEINNIEEVKSSSLPQLDSTKFLQEIFWLVIFFGILYVFVKRVFFVKIYGIKSTRHERISIYNSKILKIKKEIEAINKTINLSLEESKKNANEVIKNSLENVNRNTKDKIIRNLENEKNKKQTMKDELLEIKNMINSNASYEIVEISKSILEKINLNFLDSEIRDVVDKIQKNSAKDNSLNDKVL
jgi:F0F1-type ATP synthase membrane subunit b/b'